MSVDFTRFTDRARKVVGRLARDEALQMEHLYIGTEHFLLGLAQEKGSVAWQVLMALGIPLEKLRDEVMRLVQPSAPKGTMGQLPFTPRAKKVLELACEEAVSLRHGYVGTEHLLLGLVKEGEGVAAQVLLGLGVELEEVRKQVLEIVGVKE